VEDFGIGIIEEVQEKVFERFFRYENSETNTYPGLGLGLYIASEIIKHQRGSMKVDSKKGKGSIFCFTLPVYSA
jgi:signal transduction histidine kinase